MNFLDNRLTARPIRKRRAPVDLAGLFRSSIHARIEADPHILFPSPYTRYTAAALLRLATLAAELERPEFIKEPRFRDWPLPPRIPVRKSPTSSSFHTGIDRADGFHETAPSTRPATTASSIRFRSLETPPIWRTTSFQPSKTESAALPIPPCIPARTLPCPDRTFTGASGVCATNSPPGSNTAPQRTLPSRLPPTIAPPGTSRTMRIATRSTMTTISRKC